MKNKKGQATIFVIIGIVLLIAAGLVIYLMNSSEPDVERTTVGDELKPLQQYVEQCMTQLGSEAVIAIGRHGGYINPYDEYLSGRRFILNKENQQESDMAYLSNSEDSAVAYWYYSFTGADCTNCMMMSQAPFIEEMERQISVYISENIDECLNGFIEFKDKGYIIEYPDLMFVKTLIRDNDITIESEYPITITIDSQKTVIDKYYTIVDVPLKKYYLMALNMSVNHYNNGFFENMNMFLISSLSGLDSNKLPPLYAQTEGYDITFWTQTGVNNMLKDMLTAYMPLLQVSGTKNYRPIDKSINTGELSLYEKNFYKYMTPDFFGNGNSRDFNLKNMEINFVYTGSSLYSNVRPSKGELIGPKEYVYDYDTMLPGRRINNYQFFYDISYPVFVEIKDEYKKGQYFSFVFALEPTIKENVPLTTWWNESLNRIYWNQDFLKVEFNDPLAGSSVSGITGDKQKNYTYKSRPSESLFCDESQRLSGNTELRTTYNGFPLSDVVVSFGCGNYAKCSFGTTKNGYWNGTLPLCNNGYVEVEKPNYQTKRMPLTTELYSTVDVGVVQLDKIITKNISLKIYNVDRQYKKINNIDIFEGYNLASERPMGKNDSIIITFTRINASFDEPFSQTISYTENSNIRLIPGRYTVVAKYIDGAGVLIPKHCKKECVDTQPLNPFGGEECVEIPDDNLEIVPAVWGGIEFTDRIQVLKSDLESNKTLKMSIVRMPNPRCIDDLQEPTLISMVTQRYKTQLIPRFE